MKFPVAYDEDHLQELINANSSCPNVAEDEVSRIVDLAKQRASARGHESQMDDEPQDAIIATDWTGFAKGEFGYDNGDINKFAMGLFEEAASAGRGADLFNDTVVLQNGWLQSGDSRRSQVEPYIDDDYEGADEGEFWVPEGAQDYIAIIVIADEVLLESPGPEEAM